MPCNSRCNSCDAIVTATDVKCYVCDEPVPGARKISAAIKRAVAGQPKMERVAVGTPAKQATGKIFSFFSSLM